MFIHPLRLQPAPVTVPVGRKQETRDDRLTARRIYRRKRSDLPAPPYDPFGVLRCRPSLGTCSRRCFRCHAVSVSTSAHQHVSMSSRQLSGSAQHNRTSAASSVPVPLTDPESQYAAVSVGFQSFHLCSLFPAVRQHSKSQERISARTTLDAC